jgi:hypothetical protein
MPAHAELVSNKKKQNTIKYIALNAENTRVRGQKGIKKEPHEAALR